MTFEFDGVKEEVVHVVPYLAVAYIGALATGAAAVEAIHKIWQSSPLERRRKARQAVKDEISSFRIWLNSPDFDSQRLEDEARAPIE